APAPPMITTLSRSEPISARRTTAHASYGARAAIALIPRPGHLLPLPRRSGAPVSHNTDMASFDADVVILRAGMAGMTAADELRERDVRVLEARDRVGGRTKSGGDDRAWYNVGAQLITSPRMIAFARELGIDLIGVSEAGYSIVVDGTLSRGRSPEELLLH